jgi:uncharacterized membrane protein YphA (DoxX/SURF4 family)
MTKIISIYAVQVLLGAVALAAGYAKLSGSGLLVQQFQVLGLGQGFLMVAGTAEIVAGLCLLLPRGGILGALLLTCVMVGALGVTIGHVASAVAAQPAAARTMNSNYQASANSAAYDAEIAVTLRRKAEWSI